MMVGPAEPAGCFMVVPLHVKDAATRRNVCRAVQNAPQFIATALL